MYSKLVSFNNGIYKVYKIIMMILLAIMSIWVFVSVILREIGTSAPWIEEFTIYAFSWLTYFGAACVLRDDGHLRVTAVLNMIKSEKVKRVLAIISNLLVLVFCCVVCYYSTQMVMTYHSNGNTATNVRWVKMSYIFFQIPLNYLVYVLLQLEKIWGIVNGQKGVA